MLQPGASASERSSMAYDMGVQADRFLGNLDLWQWTDIRTTIERDAYGNPVPGGTAVVAMPPDFKVRLAMPVYRAAMLTWLIAIDLDTQGNYLLVRSKYGVSLGRHIDMISIRQGWNELQTPPQTIPENIKSRITCYPIAFAKFADAAGNCSFSIACENVMDRTTLVMPPDLQVHMNPVPNDPNPILCTASPGMGLLDEEQIESDRGIALLSALEALLRQLQTTGTLRGQFIGRFDATPTYNQAFLYTVTPASDTLWYRQQAAADPNALAGWIGPRKVGSGWADLLTVIPAGGNRFYGAAADGTLFWYQHTGFNEGTADWKGPSVVGNGWNTFAKLVGGSDGVVYAIRPDGTLVWYKHDGVESGGGVSTWRPPTVVGSGWNQYLHVFSMGNGIIYAVRTDGVMIWNHHQGFEDGSNRWDLPLPAGGGWGGYEDLFGAGDGVIFAVRRDGALLWFKHDQWSTGPTLSHAAPGEIARSRYSSTFKGPIAAGTGWVGYRHIFPMLPATPSPVR
jgi:hypothetical protein